MKPTGSSQSAMVFSAAGGEVIASAAVCNDISNLLTATEELELLL